MRMKNIYSVDDNFCVRSPLFSSKLYKTLFLKEFEKGSLENVLENKWVKEMLLVASKDLYPMLQSYRIKEKVLNDKMEMACIKYLIRSSIRCTPYGVCAGIAMGGFSSKTNVMRKSNQCGKKKSRVDMGWLFSVLRKIELEEKILKNLKVQFNYLCYERSERLINPFVYSKENSYETIAISVRYNKQVKFVKQYTQKECTFEQLYLAMCKFNAGVPTHIIKKFLYELIEKGILITELWPTLVNGDPLNYALDVLKKNEPLQTWYNRLQEIANTLKSYDSMPIGEGIEKYGEICHRMESIMKSSDYIQVDFKLDFNTLLLNRTVGETVQKTINMLCAVTDWNYEYSYIKKYKQKFIEKYGFSAAIPIKQLLDSQLGLGIPEGYQNSALSWQVEEFTDSKSKFLKYLNKEIEESIQLHKKEVILKDSEIEKCYTEIPFTYPASLEVFTKVIADNQEALDNGNYFVAFTGSELTNMAGKSLGRFFGLFNKNYAKCFYDNELKDEETLYVELSEYPISSRTANVAICNTGRAQSINLGSYSFEEKNTFFIDDIYVGVDEKNGKFYIKSKSKNKRLNVSETNMVNAKLKSPYARFLKDISQADSIPLIHTVSEINSINRTFCPRIVYDKFILRSAQWKIYKEIFEEGTSAVLNYIKRWEIPALVCLNQGENQLLLYLYNPIHFNLLLKEGKNAKAYVTLSETFVDFDSSWLIDNDNKIYENECIFYLNGNPQTKNINSITTSKLKNVNKINDIYENYFDENIRLLFGNSGWLYCKLYCDEVTANEIISEYIPLLCEMLVDKDLLLQHFFIRYMDPHNHIRLRIQVCDVKMSYSNFFEWLELLCKKGKVFNYQIEPYEREYMRYGGENLIVYAERVFSKDSELVEKLLLPEVNTDIDVDCIGILNLLEMSKAYGLELEEIMQWLSPMFSQSMYRKEFQSKRKEILNLIDCVETNKTSYILKDIYKYMKKRNDAIEEYKIKLDQEDCTNSLSNYKDSILASIFHMFCNRFRGDKIWENKVKALTRHGLYAYINKKKNYSF